MMQMRCDPSLPPEGWLNWAFAVFSGDRLPRAIHFEFETFQEWIMNFKMTLITIIVHGVPRCFLTNSHENIELFYDMSKWLATEFTWSIYRSVVERLEWEWDAGLEGHVSGWSQLSASLPCYAANQMALLGKQKVGTATGSLIIPKTMR